MESRGAVERGVGQLLEGLTDGRDQRLGFLGFIQVKSVALPELAEDDQFLKLPFIAQAQQLVTANRFRILFEVEVGLRGAEAGVAEQFAVAGIPLDRAVLAEVLTTLGSIPIAEYATPSTNRVRFPETICCRNGSFRVTTMGGSGKPASSSWRGFTWVDCGIRVAQR